jgi:predicted DNA-binding transcriptional regulator AlpA
MPLAALSPPRFPFKDDALQTAEPITLALTQHPESSSHPTTAPADNAGSNPPPRKTAIADGGAPQRPLLLTVTQVAEMCGISPTSWWRLVSKGIAPEPVHPTPGVTRWKLESVLKYVDGLKPKRRTPRVRERGGAAG